MSIFRELPHSARIVAEEQGWDDDTIACLLLAFIRKDSLPKWERDLAWFLIDRAEAENAAELLQNTP